MLKSKIAMMTHILITTNAAVLERGRDLKVASEALFLQSLQIFSGISFMANTIPRGNSIKSSKYPIIGIKSGIKSTGLSAYETTIAATILATNGTS